MESSTTNVPHTLIIDPSQWIFFGDAACFFGTIRKSLEGFQRLTYAHPPHRPFTCNSLGCLFCPRSPSTTDYTTTGRYACSVGLTVLLHQRTHFKGRGFNTAAAHHSLHKMLCSTRAAAPHCAPIHAHFGSHSFPVAMRQ